ncbi:hypothetical protein BC940DRAFT_321054 [Gongronella butleri]|nr:hypothetical protein BC940DRAFT_321054 [Gongronella butleri]
MAMQPAGVSSCNFWYASELLEICTIRCFDPRCITIVPAPSPAKPDPPPQRRVLGRRRVAPPPKTEEHALACLPRKECNGAFGPPGLSGYLEEALRHHDQPFAADYHSPEPRFLADPALMALSHEERVPHAKGIFRTLTHARVRHIGPLARSFVS